MLESYIVIDIETTGLNPEIDNTIEIGAIKITPSELHNDNQTESDRLTNREIFHSLIHLDRPIPINITSLTGITDIMLVEHGKPLDVVPANFLEFVGKLPVVAHNLDFDKTFIQMACQKYKLPPFSNRLIDTLSLARRTVKGLANYKLETLSTHFGLAVMGNLDYDSSNENSADNYALHRSLGDCEITLQVYAKLMNF